MIQLLDMEFLYSHLQACVDIEHPSLVILRFQQLFIEGMEYSNPQVEQKWQNLLNYPEIDRYFSGIINRSCYILINRWRIQRRLSGFIPRLIGVLEAASGYIATSPLSHKLRRLVARFKQTRDYLDLTHLAEAISDRYQEPDLIYPGSYTPMWEQSVANLMPRYPFMYEHCILTEPNLQHHQSAKNLNELILLKQQQQRNFEVALSRYTVNQIRHQESRNPTLLTNGQLNYAIKQFYGKFDGVHTYRGLASSFKTFSASSSCYHNFKQEFYRYLIMKMDQRCFSHKLREQMLTTLSEYDQEKVTDVLIRKTGQKWLDLLIVDNPKHLQHLNLVNFTGNIGTPATISLFLKMILFCQNLKQDLEKKFAILFQHYEDCTNEIAGWFIDCLEHLNVALAIHFPAYSLSR